MCYSYSLQFEINHVIQKSTEVKLEHMYTTLDIHARLIETFPNCKIPLRETAGTVASKKAKTTYLDEGAHFILQLHDELYYEVKRELK